MSSSNNNFNNLSLRGVGIIFDFGFRKLFNLSKSAEVNAEIFLFFDGFMLGVNANGRFNRLFCCDSSSTVCFSISELDLLALAEFELGIHVLYILLCLSLYIPYIPE